MSPFESLPLGDARGDHLHAPHRRGAARILAVHRAGEARLARIAKESGFSTFKRAAETPFNLILEARR